MRAQTTSTNILERDRHLNELETALAEACTNQGTIALVSGEAGIGKTTLVEQFTRGQKNRLRVLWGMCDPLFTPRPLGPLFDMAAQMPATISSLLTPESNRSLLFSTLLAELQCSSTIVVFEDVHWADAATFDLLRFIGRRISNTSTLLVLTYRDEEIDSQHPLRIVLGDLASSAALRRIALPPLSEDAVRVLVGKQRLDAAMLHRRSGGNPFFITEVLASEGAEIPATVREVVLARMARLSRAGLTVLEAAAVIGQRVEPWLLKAFIAGEDRPEVDATDLGDAADAIDECLGAGMLRAHRDALFFRHELARETVLESIYPSRKAELHRLVLNSLRSSPTTSNDLARLTYHAEACGDRDTVLELGPPAASRASTTGAHREAAALYELVLACNQDLHPSEHAMMLEAYSRECNLVERSTEAIESLRKALAIWQDLQNIRKQGETLALLTIMLRNYGRNPEAEQLSQAAIDLLEPLPPCRELALAYRAQATMRLATRDNTDAISWGERAIALAQKYDDLYIQGMAHSAVGSAWMFEDYERGCKYLRTRLQREHEYDQAMHIGNLYMYLGSCSAELHQFADAQRYLEEGISNLADQTLVIISRSMLAWLALTHVYRGDWNEADRITSHLLANLGSSVLSSIPTLVARGRLQARRGDPGAWGTLNDALQIALRTDNLPHFGLVRCARAEAAWLSDRPRLALEEAKAVYELALSKRHPWFAGEMAFWRWRTGDKAGIPDWIALPFALHTAGDWQGTASEWQRLGCPYERACALADGDSEAQLEALGIFDNLGARPAAKALRKKLKTAGIRRLPREPRTSTRENPFGLTNRQLEVLTLLIEGLSNAEIAAHLFISPKTADHHVSAVLASLDVHSRHEATAHASHHPYFQNRKIRP